MDAVRSLVLRLVLENQQVIQKVQDLKRQVAELSGKTVAASLNLQTSGAVASANSFAEAVSGAIESVDDASDAASETIEQMSSTAVVAASSISSAMQGTAAAMENVQSAATSAIEAVSSTTSQAAGAVSSATNSMTSAQTKAATAISSTMSSISTMQTRISSIGATMLGAVSRTGSAFDVVHSAVGRVQSAFGQLGHAISTSMTTGIQKIGQLGKNLKDIDSDISTILGTLGGSAAIWGAAQAFDSLETTLGAIATMRGPEVADAVREWASEADKIAGATAEGRAVAFSDVIRRSKSITAEQAKSLVEILEKESIRETGAADAGYAVAQAIFEGRKEMIKNILPGLGQIVDLERLREKAAQMAERPYYKRRGMSEDEIYGMLITEELQRAYQTKELPGGGTLAEFKPEVSGFAKLNEVLREIAKTLGEGLMPYINLFIGAMAALSWVLENIPGAKEFAALALILLTVLSGIAAVAAAAMAMTGVLGALGITTETVAGAFGVLRGAMTALAAHPLLLALMAIAVVLYMVEQRTHILSRAFNALKNALGGLNLSGGGVLTLALTPIGMAFTAISKIIEFVKQLLSHSELGVAFIELINSWIEAIYNLLRPWAEWLRGLFIKFTSFWEWVVSLPDKIVNGIVNGLKSILGLGGDTERRKSVYETARSELEQRFGEEMKRTAKSKEEYQRGLDWLAGYAVGAPVGAENRPAHITDTHLNEARRIGGRLGVTEFDRKAVEEAFGNLLKDYGDVYGTDLLRAAYLQEFFGITPSAELAQQISPELIKIIKNYAPPKMTLPPSEVPKSGAVNAPEGTPEPIQQPLTGAMNQAQQAAEGNYGAGVTAQVNPLAALGAAKDTLGAMVGGLWGGGMTVTIGSKQYRIGGGGVQSAEPAAASEGSVQSAEQTAGGGTAPKPAENAVPAMQTGGIITETGLVLAHRGEEIVPAEVVRESTSLERILEKQSETASALSSVSGIEINGPLIGEARIDSDYDIEDLADKLFRALRSRLEELMMRNIGHYRG
ncbi:MAG: hypothetical protein QHG98_07500 [Methanothrix sp.]|jgi:hypothetical protein|nr:hypothetical protein [Methanothrix sp.]